MKNNEKIYSYITELKQNPILKDYEMNIDNVNDFAVYLEEYNNCKKCNSLNECKNNAKGYRTNIIKNNNKYDFPLSPCEYRNEELKQIKSKKFIRTMFIAPNVLDAKLAKFDQSTKERVIIYEESIRFIESIKNDVFSRGLAIYGPYSTGKTYLLASIANELSNNKVSSLLVYFPSLITELKNAINDGTFNEMYESIKCVDVLLIDDLGSEMMTSWVRDEILGPILNYRLEEKLPICLTTNLSIEQLIDHLATAKDTGIDQTKSTRIMDRIKGLAKSYSLSEKKYSR